MEVPKPGKIEDALVMRAVVPRVHFTQTVDLGKAGTVSVQYFYITQDDELRHCFEWLLLQQAVGYDVETGGLDVWRDPLATIQLGNPLGADPRAYVIDVRSVSFDALLPILSILAGEHVRKLGQNVKFECLWTQYHLRTSLRNVACTQTAELLLRAGLFTSKALPSGKAAGGEKAGYSHSSMANLCRYYLGIEIDKDDSIRLTFASTPPGKHSKRHIVYAAGDVVYPFYIAERQRPELARRGLNHICKLEFDLIPVLADTELAGIGIDVPYWKQLYQEAVVAQDGAERALDRMFLGLQGDLFGNAQKDVRPIYLGGRGKGDPLNWAAPEQVKWAVARYCATTAWPVKVLTTYGQVRTAKVNSERGRQWLAKRQLTEQQIARTQKDAEAGVPEIPDWVLSESEYCILVKADYDTLTLRRLRDQLPNDFVVAIQAYAEYKALTSTFGADYLKHQKQDGRIHVEFHPLIAQTGRMSTTPNLQNIPKDPRYRRAFVPRAGWQFVIADYSSIEPRISAFVSGDAVYTATFMDPKGDLYLNLAERFYGYRPVKKSPERDATKSTALGLAYRMGKGKLRDKLTIDLLRPVSFEEASELHEKFATECEGITAYQQLCERKADPESRDKQQIWEEWLGEWVTYIQSPCGRVRFFAPNARDIYTAACNMPVQGLSATVTKAAAVLIQRYIDKHATPAHGVNYVHDEIVYEVRDDHADAFAAVVKDLMEEAGRKYIPTIPVRAEFPEGSNGVVPYWAKEIK